MIDPFTAMAAATTAYNGIKKAVSVGREISAMTGAVSQWSKAVSDLDFLEDKAKNPPMYKMFSDNQSNALEIPPMSLPSCIPRLMADTAV